MFFAWYRREKDRRFCCAPRSAYMKRRDPIRLLTLAGMLCAASACKNDKDALTADASAVMADDSGTATGHDAGTSGDGAATHVTVADGQLEGVVDGKTRK